MTIKYSEITNKRSSGVQEGLLITLVGRVSKWKHISLLMSIALLISLGLNVYQSNVEVPEVLKYFIFVGK